MHTLSCMGPARQLHHLSVCTSPSRPVSTIYCQVSTVADWASTLTHQALTLTHWVLILMQSSVKHSTLCTGPSRPSSTVYYQVLTVAHSSIISHTLKHQLSVLVQVVCQLSTVGCQYLMLDTPTEGQAAEWQWGQALGPTTGEQCVSYLTVHIFPPKAIVLDNQTW